MNKLNLVLAASAIALAGCAGDAKKYSSDGSASGDDSAWQLVTTFRTESKGTEFAGL